MDDVLHWRTIEIMGYAHYAHQGFNILVPLAQILSYDFVIEKNGLFRRMNVKLATRQNYSWRFSTRDYGGTLIDEYLIWLPQSMRFIELESSLFPPSKWMTRTIPKRYLNELD